MTAYLYPGSYLWNSGPSTGAGVYGNTFSKAETITGLYFLCKAQSGTATNSTMKALICDAGGNVLVRGPSTDVTLTTAGGWIYLPVAAYSLVANGGYFLGLELVGGYAPIFASYSTNSSYTQSMTDGGVWSLNPVNRYDSSGVSAVSPGSYFSGAIRVMGVVTNTAPNVPTAQSYGGQTWVGNNWNSGNVILNGNITDPDGDALTAYRVVGTVDGYATYRYDTGIVATSFASGSNFSLYVPVSSLFESNQWQFAVQFRDPAGAWGNWGYWSIITIDKTAPTGTVNTPSPQYLNVPAGGTFRVQATVSDALSGIQNVRFPTWTDVNGQDDIVWYDGVNAGGGVWYKDIPIANHGNAEGLYITHPYAYDNAGNTSAMLGQISTYVDRTTPAVPTQTNGILYAATNGVSWSTFSDAQNTSGRKSTAIHLQVYNGSSWAYVNGFPLMLGDVLSYSFIGLTAGANYRWGIVYTDNAGNANALTWTNFTTNTYPVTSLTNLASAGYLLNTKPKLTFTVTDGNGDTLTDFQLQISTVSNFSTTVVAALKSANSAGWGSINLPSGSVQSYTLQTALAAGTYYVRAATFDGKDWSSWSAIKTVIIQAVSWPTVISDTDTIVSKRTIDSLRIATNAVRQARGLAAVAWTNPVIQAWNESTPTDIRVTHLTELRQAITDIFVSLAYASPIWTDTSITPSTDRKGKHWAELRNVLLQC